MKAPKKKKLVFFSDIGIIGLDFRANVGKENPLTRENLQNIFLEIKIKNPFEKKENHDKPISSFTKKTTKIKQEAERETCIHTLHTKKKQRNKQWVTEGLLARNVTAETNGGNGPFS